MTSDVFVRRLTPALATFVKDGRDFRIIDLHRPIGELRKIVRSCRPSALITEWLPRLTEGLLELGYPTVIADTDEIFSGAASLDVDDHAVGAAAARFFRQAGYRHFGCAHLQMPYASQRFAGFRDTLAGEGFSCADFSHADPPGHHYMESWRETRPALQDWLRGLPKPAAIFAVHDPLGRRVCEAALETGLQIPHEVAVLGANNDELVCGLSHPPLSSVAIPWSRLGALAGEWVERLLAGEAPPAAPILVPPGPAVIRRSTALTAVDDPELRRVLHYLHDHATEPLTIEETCRTLRVSRRALERKFALHLKATPWETLCRMRTDRARRLLIETDLPMALIAERSGFENAERFSVVFRRQSGQTPSAFRKTARTGASGG